MSDRRKQAKQSASDAARAAAVATGSPSVGVRDVDAAVLGRRKVYAEAVHQTRPLASSSADVQRIADMARQGTARSSGLTQEAAERMATARRPMGSFAAGQNVRGKAAEIVAASDYRALHAGDGAAVVNPPGHVASNLRDIRLAPDGSSRKDFVLAFETKSGEAVWKYNGQVKTGGARYVADTLVEMAETPRYGKVAYVDARYVNADGTPRVATDAFTKPQARRIQQAKVQLRGISNLETRADHLLEDIRAGTLDGLDPVSRRELEQLRDDIARAYRARGVVGRIGGGAAIAAAAAALLSLAVQLATEGKVDVKIVGKSAGAGALYGASAAAADAALYRVGTNALEMAPEAARAFASQGVATGFCVLAVGSDVVAEVRAARRGDRTVASAMAGSAAKAALDLLPLLMAPLGLAGLPVLVGAQVGGRWLIRT
jgi:hypothetical protein